MYCILTIGMTGQGKTTQFVKKFIEGKNCLVFDVQNEYKDLSTVITDPRARWMQPKNLKGFFLATEQKRNTICVFEEATIFFQGRTEVDLRLAVISKRHTNNTYIFCFHSISSVPPRLMQLTNFVALFKTGDERYQVESKFPRLLPYYDKIQTLPKYDFIPIKLIEQ